jgi:hypothetical protein
MNPASAAGHGFHSTVYNQKSTIENFPLPVCVSVSRLVPGTFRMFYAIPRKSGTI